MNETFVKCMLKLAFPQMFEEGTDDTMDDTRRILEEKIKEMADRPSATAEDLLTLSRAYAELARNDWMAKIPTTPQLFNGVSAPQPVTQEDTE